MRVRIAPGAVDLRNRSPTARGQSGGRGVTAARPNSEGSLLLVQYGCPRRRTRSPCRSMTVSSSDSTERHSFGTFMRPSLHLGLRSAVLSVVGSPARWNIGVRVGTGGVVRCPVPGSRPLAIRVAIQEKLDRASEYRDRHGRVYSPCMCEPSRFLGGRAPVEIRTSIDPQSRVVARGV